jgi:predicted AAA+ superfamily ATPase
VGQQRHPSPRLLSQLPGFVPGERCSPNLEVTSLRDFERFIRACAARSGQLLNKTELARNVGVSQKTITDWLSVLEASNQIALLEPYFGNVGKRLVKTPRLFFCDPGLLCFLLGLSGDSLPSYQGLGHIWETFMYAELRKLKEVFAIESSLWFYRDSLAREVDFVLARGGTLSLFEVKWTEIPTQREVATLEAVAQTLGAIVKENAVLCRTRTRFPITAQTQAVSAFALRDLFTGPA